MSNVAGMTRRPFLVPAAIAALFAITVLCYWPSLDGQFIFDDIPNLETLGERDGIDSADKLVEFVVSGESGPLGRPLSLLTFAMNGQDWPTDPTPFRITNLVIHLANGLLVFLLARSLLGTVHERDIATRLAVVCMALWILHPLAASTTAYIIQRMTQLANLFILIGLLSYVHGRKMLPQRPRAGWTWIIVGMGVSGTFAVLSKESGALLPLYALVIELTAFSAITLPARHRAALITLLCAPILLIAGYLAFRWGAIEAGYDLRAHTMGERLLTQAVVLTQYLKQIFAPALSGLGIIQDDFPVSRSLLSPISTLLSVVLLTALLVFAAWCRNRLPLVALGIFWFFAGHSLEAGPLPLELYFDHRNYLPMFGPLIAVCSVLPRLPQGMRRATPLILVLFLSFLAFLTWQSAKLWGNKDLMMQVALIDHPNSLRARQHQVNRMIVAGQYERALSAQLELTRQFPDHTATRLSILNLRCIENALTAEQVSETQSLLRQGRLDTQVIGYFPPLLENAVRETCDAFDLDDYHATLDALLDNPRTHNRHKIRGAVHYFKALAYEQTGQLDGAIEQLDLSYEAVPETDVRLQQVVWLIAADRPDQAEELLDLARQHLSEHFWTRDLREADLKLLQQQIDQAKRLQQDSRSH